MLNKEFPVPLERWMTNLAILTILVGAVFVEFIGWAIFGGVVIVYGVMTLFLAYLMGNAPCLEEVDGDLYVVRKTGARAVRANREEEIQSERLAESKVQKVAN